MEQQHTNPETGRAGTEQQDRADCGREATAVASDQVDLKDRFFALTFGIGKSLRYQTKRRSFFSKLALGTTILTLLFSTAAFVSITDEKGVIAAACSLLVAALTIIDLVVGFEKRANAHDQLHQRFTDLKKRLILSDRSEAALKDGIAHRLEIEKDEPTQLAALNILCHNEEAMALGCEDGFYHLTGWQRLMRHFLSFDGVHFPEVKKAQADMPEKMIHIPPHPCI